MSPVLLIIGLVMLIVLGALFAAVFRPEPGEPAAKPARRKFWRELTIKRVEE